MTVSRMAITRSKRGTTIRASGAAAQALFNQMAAIGRAEKPRRPAVEKRFQELKRMHPNTPDAELLNRAKAEITASK